MCGRYYIGIDDKELQAICDNAEKNTQMTLKTSGEIYPTDIVPVQTAVRDYQPMKWGFSGFDKKPIINARSETALSKPMFQKSMLERRCIVPASGYYEWRKSGSEKQKYQIYFPNQVIYLVGCFRREKDNPYNSFVILTKSAANDIEFIHDRMPVILPHNKISDWFLYGAEVFDAAVDSLEYRAV